MSSVPEPSWIPELADGAEAHVLARMLAEDAGGLILFVARDAKRMERTQTALRFFAPQARSLSLPAWDTLPYDRVSPSVTVSAQRLRTLYRLAHGRLRPPLVVFTTLNAFLQKVPPPDWIVSQARALRVREQVRPDILQAWLAEQAYRHVDLVQEPGEYAMRGGLMDLYAPGAPMPARLDFFGDTLESLRSFDPLNQRSQNALEHLLLLPASEVPRDESGRERFRAAYRALSGTSGADDPLYEAVTAGRAYAGIEHWQPLFFEALVPLLDYLPQQVPLVLDTDLQATAIERIESVQEFYQARLDARKPGSLEPTYHPVPPSSLTWSREEWDALPAARPLNLISAFSVPKGAGYSKRFANLTRPALSFLEARQNPNRDLFEEVRLAIREAQGRKQKILLAGMTKGSSERLGALLFERGLNLQHKVTSLDEVLELKGRTVGVCHLPFDTGFQTPDFALISEQDILGERIARPRRRRRADQFLRDASTLVVGDLVVHTDKGIGRYEGIETLDIGGAAHDVLSLTYAGGDRLYVPVENIEVLSRFGDEFEGVTLDKLGATSWQHRKAKAKSKLKDMAEELIRIAAERTMRTAPQISPSTAAVETFAASFPFSETDDQLNAIDDTMEDLAAGRPMDRLICGDVGFGKTEVAMRAAFAAAMEGLQVALVVPTTLLARQHYLNFSQRFKDTPLRLAHLSRLVPSKEQERVREGLRYGQVDIVIGTHALLADSIRFRNLGLLILDEEQRFGVRQKEKLKNLRSTIHVLTLTATPIPRTLQLSLTGVKDLSLIGTPPVDRLAVRTHVTPWDGVIMREALMREHFRGGQSFVVCPLLRDLAEMKDRLAELVPELRVGVAHGQLKPSDLESVMNAFYERQFDILLSTNIIESGIDISNANTLILHRADRFGLSQLYQLRGRVGRSKQRGYAYLTLEPNKKLTYSAEKRLKAMQTLDSLGAGFSLASHDMDIRGAGNLLGEEQSGHVREVGVELYQHLLEEAVSRAKLGEDAETFESDWSPQINLGLPILIPDAYVDDLNLRLMLYRRLGEVREDADVEAFAAELIDRFGPIPPELKNLLNVMLLKLDAKRAGVQTLDAGPRGVVVGFREDKFEKPEKLMRWIKAVTPRVKLRADQKIFVSKALDTPEQRLKVARSLLRDLVGLLD